MKRKIYDQLLLWKNKRKGKFAMMIESVRCVLFYAIDGLTII